MTESEPGRSAQAARLEAGGAWILGGFRVSFRDLSTDSDGEMPDAEATHTCRMVMCLDGDMRIGLAESGTIGEILVPSGHCLLLYRPGTCGCAAFGRKQHTRVLDIVCPVEGLRSLASDTPLGRDLQAAMACGRPMHTLRPMSNAILQASEDLRESIVAGGPGSAPLILSKALEVLWHFIAPDGQAPDGQIPPETRHAVDKAKSILAAGMDDPPCLGALAYRVGMSLSKLKQVFPKACGMTPYEYLRTVRMERAMHLLRDEGRSVTETALEVGYSNLSHFSKTFTAHFGMKPSRAKAAEPGTGPGCERPLSGLEK